MTKQPPQTKRAPPTKSAPQRKRKQQPVSRAQFLWQHRRIIGIGVAVLLGLLVVDTFLVDFLPFDLEPDPAQAITDPDAPLASFYAPEVLAWRSEILEWAKTYDVNPNVIAIVIQIESCGDPAAMSWAGALGLMQVMPFHFDNGENMLNPDTNVRNGMTVFYECLTQFADWDLGLALACYNGGPRVTQIDYDMWADETQHYYRWATGLWGDVQRWNDSSETLDEWLNAGGERLCRRRHWRLNRRIS